MRLFEHEAKTLFREHHLPVPRGFVASTVEQVERRLLGLHATEVVVKAQLPIGGRRKAGAVKTVPVHQAARAAADLLLRRFHGYECHEVLVEERVPVQDERFLSLLINGAAQRVECLYSREGGSDVEMLARRGKALQRTLVREEGDLANLGAEPGVAEFAKRLLRVMHAADAELVEANPLALSRSGELVALDAKVIVDDNALYRHPHLQARQLARLSEPERKAAHAGLHFVPLHGDIAVIGNGAGLVMSLADALMDKGAKPACFLDLRGGTGEDAVRTALEVASELEPKVILLAAFGGATRTDEVARGLLRFRKDHRMTVPLVVRIRGTNEQRARRLLETAGVHALRDLDEAVARAVHLAREADR